MGALADNYSALPGVVIRGGRFGLPAWRPAPGFFAEASLNTLADVAPAGWPLTDIASPFSNWSGNNSNPDLGPLGGTSNLGSGHLALATNAQWAGVNNFAAHTRLFSMSNVPPFPVSDSNTNYPYWEIPAGQPGAGFTMIPHTYGGTLIRPSHAGGGPKGSLVRIDFAGAGAQQASHEHDISLPFGAPSRVITGVASGTSYPAACLTEDGKGFYLLNYTGNGPMRLYTFGTVQGQPYAYELVPGGASFNEYGNVQIALKPGPSPCLVATCNSGSGGVNFAVYVCPIVNRMPQSWVRVNPTGAPPADPRCGVKWSKMLQCFVTNNGGGTTTIHRLNPPSSGPMTADAWSWSSEVVVGLNGAVMSRTRSADNGTWGNMVESVECGCFFYCNSIFDKMIAITLQGM